MRLVTFVVIAGIALYVGARLASAAARQGVPFAWAGFAGVVLGLALFGGLVAWDYWRYERPARGDRGGRR